MPKIFSGLGELTTNIEIGDTVSSPIGGVQYVDDTRVSNDFEVRDSNRNEDVTTDAVTIESKFSTSGHFSSIFNDFRFEAIPVYNFYVDGEESDDKTSRNGRKLEEIPRYIHLKWRTAPITDKPQRSSTSEPTTKRYRSSSSKKEKQVLAFQKRGISFDKTLLENFSSIKGSLANGYVAPGTISAVIELPLNRATAENTEIDEQDYLKSKESEGISIHDVQANVNINMNGALGASDISKKSTAKSLKNLSNGFFEGSSFIQNDHGNRMIVKNISSSKAVKLELQTPNKVNEAKTVVDDACNKICGKLYSNELLDFTEVNFVNPAITGLVSKDKIDFLSAPEHIENMAGIAPFMANLKMLSEVDPELKRKKNIPSFPATEEESGTRYVGYVIEKYKQNDDGVFSLVDEIDIPDASTKEFIDTKVSYGSLYRYRIRAILKWTRKSNVTHEGFEEGNFFDVDFSQTKSLATHKSSFFASEWNRKWKHAFVIDSVLPGPPDEFMIRPESHKKRIVISWKLPYDPQRDIHYYKLLRKLKNADGKDISDWDVIGIKMGPTNVLHFDYDVDFVENNGTIYVYAAQTISKHEEESLLSCQLGCSITSQYLKHGEKEIKQYSSSGVPINAVGSFSVYPPVKRSEEIQVRKKILLTLRDGFFKSPFRNKKYVLRLQSLSTGQEKDIPLDIIYDNSIEKKILTKNEYAESAKLLAGLSNSNFRKSNAANIDSSGESSESATYRGTPSSAKQRYLISDIFKQLK